MKNFISRVTGKIARTEFPYPLQKVLNRIFIGVTKINLSDFSPTSSYRSIQALFTRSLASARSLPKNPRTLISPADSTLVQYGEIHDEKILQVKGLTYEADEFLTSHADHKMTNGCFINFYLAPYNYHHFHSPVDLRVSKIIHVPGTLFPVNKRYQKKTRNLFVKNERVILEGTMPNGKHCAFVAIGAFNVGRIKILKEPRLQTNLSKKVGVRTWTYKKPLHFERGEDLGFFEMGSSVVLLFQKGSMDFDPKLKVGQPICFGDRIGTLLA